MRQCVIKLKFGDFTSKNKNDNHSSCCLTDFFLKIENSSIPFIILIFTNMIFVVEVFLEYINFDIKSVIYLSLYQCHKAICNMWLCKPEILHFVSNYFCHLQKILTVQFKSSDIDLELSSFIHIYV